MEAQIPTPCDLCSVNPDACATAMPFSKPAKYCGQWMPQPSMTTSCCCAESSICARSQFSCKCIDPTPRPIVKPLGFPIGAIVCLVIGFILIVAIAIYFICSRRFHQYESQIRARRVNIDGYAQSGSPISTEQPFANEDARNGYDRRFAKVPIIHEQPLNIKDALDSFHVDEKALVMIEILSVRTADIGEVWSATYFGRHVVVKKLLRDTLPREIFKFVQEVSLLAKVRSEYVIEFIGVSWHHNDETSLVLEYMDLGDVRGVLERSDTTSFSVEQKMDCALQVIKGLVYLHSFEPSIAHRDVKASNILMDSTKGSKLADFSLSKEMTAETMTIGIGTYRWMAPEVINDNYYTSAADIYSFGVFLSELDTHKIPYTDQRTDRGRPLTDATIMGRVISGKIQPTFTCIYPPWFIHLAKGCLSLNASDRPSAYEIMCQMEDQAPLSGFV